MNSSQFDRPISLPSLPRDHLTPERFLATVERVVQSNNQFTLDDSLNVNVIHVEMPQGAGNGKRHDIVNLKAYLNKKAALCSGYCRGEKQKAVLSQMQEKALIKSPTTHVETYASCVTHRTVPLLSGNIAETERNVSNAIKTTTVQPKRYVIPWSNSTLEKTQYLCENGYNVIEIWTCDIQCELNNFKICEPLEPQQAFFGGCPNATHLYHEARDDDKIHYVDFCSLSLASGFPAGCDTDEKAEYISDYAAKQEIQLDQETDHQESFKTDHQESGDRSSRILA
ncbi:Hypothetical predicted protein [Paramuricea clavata]|uniref:Uncharacterized protein n=1 Tax=Paramuricea clavata TaxID=317549 RepID=A0A6S7FLX4_PARCT|nr:Hypothetical predicted protein [Paramuricea clavata]